MSQESKDRLAPFISILVCVVVGLLFVFVKMETVKVSYDLVRLKHFEKVALDEKSHLDLVYAKLIRPERLDFIATQRLELARAQKDQVIMMAATGNIAVRQ